MFTGIIEERGTVLAVDSSRGAARLTVRAPLVAADARHGDSIAVSGVCLTVVGQTGDSFTADVMAETLKRSTVGRLRPGDEVNLERSVTPTTRLGGHVVQGHVDGLGVLMRRDNQPEWDEITVRVPGDLGRFLAPKGAVALDGISLTVIDVVDTDAGTEFSVGIIPETRTATTVGSTAVGEQINIEVDVMAKYVARLLGSRAQEAGGPAAGSGHAWGTPS
jgi:riboflavin synthase